MGDVVNLRLVRKAVARKAAADIAADNRARHGRSKVERELSAAREAKAQANLDGHRRTASAPRPDSPISQITADEI